MSIFGLADTGEGEMLSRLLSTSGCVALLVLSLSRPTAAQAHAGTSSVSRSKRRVRRDRSSAWARPTISSTLHNVEAP